MKKIIWIDVGTHFAQEHNSLFSSSLGFYYFVCKRFIGGMVLKRGRFVSFNQLKDIISSRAKIRKKSDAFFSIFVEANPKIVRKMSFYPCSDLSFNIALTEESSSTVSIAKLFVGHGDELSEGNTLFEKKFEATDKTYMATLGITSDSFFQQVKEYLDEKFVHYKVLLRLNCEGVEDSVIYSARKNFGSKLKLILGSLKDVEELKGAEAAQNLNNFIVSNNLNFVKFSSGIYSWPQAHIAISELLENES